MGTTRSNKEALGKMGAEMMTFGSPVDRIKQDTRQGLTDILYGPFRIVGNIAMNTLKGIGKLFGNAPVIPISR